MRSIFQSTIMNSLYHILASAIPLWITVIGLSILLSGKITKRNSWIRFGLIVLIVSGFVTLAVGVSGGISMSYVKQFTDVHFNYLKLHARTAGITIFIGIASGYCAMRTKNLIDATDFAVPRWINICIVNASLLVVALVLTSVVASKIR